MSRGRLFWWFLALVIAATIFVESSRAAPSIGSQTSNDTASVVAHLVLYAGLAFSLHRGLGGTGARALAFAVGIAALYGVSDEVHQALVPQRDANLLDVLTDFAGAVAGASASAVLRA